MNITPTSPEKYVAHFMGTVQGYLTSLDARLIAALLKFQDENNIEGHLCEVGVHHGRLFLMLALARRSAERALAIDLFEDDTINANTRHAGRDRALLANARRLGIELSEEETYKTSSLNVDAGEILRRTTGRIRFFSVDGCHLYRHVENDLRLAESTLTDDGIIAVDDFFNVNWADVSFATYDFLRQTDKMVPFAITSKLYLAAPDIAEKYKTALGKHNDLGQTSCVQILGKEVLAAKQGMLERGYEAFRDLISSRAS
jgi:methyltransferase family protein